MANLVQSRWIPAALAAGAQIAGVIVAAVGFIGPPPVESMKVVVLSHATVYWIVGLWLASLGGVGATLYRLNRERRDADDARAAAFKDRDVAMAALTLKRENQVLSDLMSEQWEFGIHELLNKPPVANNRDSFKQWQDSVKRWAQKTVSLMKDHGCTKQDIRSVKVIGLAPLIPTLHAEFVVAHAMSMAAAQIDRVADIARKYGD